VITDLTLVKEERQGEVQGDKTAEDDPPRLLACPDESRGSAAEEDDLNERASRVCKS
jgi:hypothetical protein